MTLSETSLTSVVEVGHWPFQFKPQVIANDLKSIVAITTSAITLLASTYLAYQHPTAWFWTTCSTCVLSLYLLPKILHHATPTWIKTSLIVNYTVLASLLLGGMSALIISLGKATWIALQIHHFSAALLACFLSSAVVGYAVPVCQSLLKKSYRLMMDNEEWKERFKHLHQQFQNIPSLGASFLKTELRQGFLLHFAFLNSGLLFATYRLIHHFFNRLPPLPNYVWSMVSAVNQIDLNHFRTVITDFEQLAEVGLQYGEILPVQTKDNFLWKLKTILRSMNQEDLSQAIPYLLEHGSKLVPYVLTPFEFLNILTEDALEATEASIQQFLDLMLSWEATRCRHQHLQQKVIELEQEIRSLDLKKLPLDQQEKISERHQQVKQEYNKVLAEVKKFYLAKRIWQDFASLWAHSYELPFEKGDTLLSVLHNDTLLQNIDQTYRSMLGGEQRANRSLSMRLQYITNKLLSIQAPNEEEESSSALMFLGSHQNFVQQDYTDLQAWFNLSSPHDLEEAMEKIGLKTEEDLYKKGILARQTKLSKENIRTHLQNYINKTPQTKTLYRLQEKVIRVVYHAIYSGLILVPMVIFPQSAAFGFVAGTIFFVLKRFGVRGTQTVANVAVRLTAFVPFFGNIMLKLLNRRVLSMTLNRTQLATQFVNSHFFKRVQAINTLLLASFFVSHAASFVISEIATGGLLQGIAFSREVVELF